jgi:hypothetical protein
LSNPVECGIVEDLYIFRHSIDCFRSIESEVCTDNAQDITEKVKDIAFILDQCYNSSFKTQCDSRLAALLAEITEKLPELEEGTHQLSSLLLDILCVEAGDILDDLPTYQLKPNIYNILAAFHALNESIDDLIRWYNSAETIEDRSPKHTLLFQLSINFEEILPFVDLWAKRLRFLADIDLFCEDTPRRLLNIFIQELQRLYLKIKILGGSFIKSAKTHAFEEIKELMQSGVQKSITKQDGTTQQISLNELLAKMNISEGATPYNKLVFDKNSVIYRIGNLAANLQQVLDDFKIKR